MAKNFEEQLSRVRMMAAGNPTWDLSPNDQHALQTMLLNYDALAARVDAKEEPRNLPPAIEALVAELYRARLLHKPINSAHEGYAVILEELQEFWAEVMKKLEHRNKVKMRDDLIQIAAMAIRTAEDVL